MSHSPLPVAVLDSSVLVSAWSRRLLQQFALPADPRFMPVWSEWIIAETWRVLAWRWLRRVQRMDAAEHARMARDANQMLRYLVPIMTLVSIRGYAGPSAWPGLRDVDDEPIWETAAVAGAQYVVSHNTRDARLPTTPRRAALAQRDRIPDRH